MAKPSPTLALGAALAFFTLFSLSQGARAREGAGGRPAPWGAGGAQRPPVRSPVTGRREPRVALGLAGAWGSKTSDEAGEGHKGGGSSQGETCRRI